MLNDSSKPIEVVLANPNPLILLAMSEKLSTDPRFSLGSTVVNAGNFIDCVRLPVDLAVVCWRVLSD